MRCLIGHTKYWNFFLYFINATKWGFKYSIFMTLVPSSRKENVAYYSFYIKQILSNKASYRTSNGIRVSFAAFLKHRDIHIKDSRL